MLIKNIYVFISLLVISFSSFSQVGINTTDVDFSSILHIYSSEKGVLFPTLNMEQRDNINTTAANNSEIVPAGLVIYCSDCCNDGTGSLYYYNGVTWKSLDSTCKEVGSFPSCNPVTTTIVADNHIQNGDIPLLFDNNFTNGTQPNSNDLRLHHNDEGIVEFTLDTPLPVGGKIVLYWSDDQNPGNMGLIVDLDNGGTTSQPSIDTLLNVLPNSTNISNGVDDDYILTITLISDTDTITIKSFDDGFGADPRLLEFKILDDNDVEIPFTCS